MSKTFRRSDGFRKNDWRNSKAKKHFKKLEKNKFKKHNNLRQEINEDYKIYDQESERY